MDISKAIGTIEDKADWLVGLGVLAARYAEDGGSIMNIPQYIIGDVTYELQQIAADPIARVKYKLIDSPHLYTTVFKFSVAAMIAGYLGFLPKRYETLAKKAAIGSGVVALLSKGSGPTTSSSTQIPGMQNLARPMSVYSGPATAGSLYTTSTSRLIGN